MVKMKSTGLARDLMIVTLSVPLDSDSDKIELAMVEARCNFSICKSPCEWTVVATVDVEGVPEIGDVMSEPGVAGSSSCFRALLRLGRQSWTRF